MRLYNTLTRTKEDFAPLTKNTARVYSCGPTVYYTAHIGNLRAYICGDILKKALRFNGYEVDDVMNITDVGHLVGDGDSGEDKVEKTARSQGVHPLEIAKKYTDIFMDDIRRLNIAPAKHIVPATTCIDEMIKLISALQEKGFTYKTGDGIYFDAGKVPEYFKLSKGNLEGNRGGARVDLGGKKNINDFALWKFVSPETIQKWDSPWGVGCPGWHIECSAISAKYLGVPFDIHTGGVDHIPVHHTNEIAQTESATGSKMANFWFHNEFMTVDNGKMSKSVGNVYTLADLISRGFEPMHFRYLTLLTTYRSVLNFSFDALTAAKTAYRHTVSALKRHRNSTEKTPKKTIDELTAEFAGAINDDLNTPRVLAAVNKALKLPASNDIFRLITTKFDAVLSLSLAEAAAETGVEIPDEIAALAEKRAAAKRSKDFASADKLRNKIETAGFTVTDSKDGYKIEPHN
jgi:cysteinyl-tRNA synthetase